MKLLSCKSVEEFVECQPLQRWVHTLGVQQQLKGEVALRSPRSFPEKKQLFFCTSRAAREPHAAVSQQGRCQVRHAVPGRPRAGPAASKKGRPSQRIFSSMSAATFFRSSSKGIIISVPRSAASRCSRCCSCCTDGVGGAVVERGHRKKKK